MILTPPLWATGAWADDVWADGSWSASVSATVLTIAGVTKTLQQGWSIQEITNGINTFTFEVLSIDGTYRPPIGSEVLLTEDGTRIFGGTVDVPNEHGIGGIPGTKITNRITAVDFNELAYRRVLNLTIPTGTVADAMADLIAYIPGATVHPSQVAGPTLPEMTFSFMRVHEALDQIAVIAEMTWEVDYQKRLRMAAPSATAAPFTITTANRKADGDITVEPSQAEYANRIHVLGGSGQQSVEDAFTGDGVTVAFDLTYTLAGHEGFVAIGVVPEGLGATGSGNIWEHSTSNGVTTITRTSAPANLAAITIPYTAQLPLLVTSDDAPEQSVRGMHERIYTTELYDKPALQALADAYLARHLLEPRTVRYVTREVGIHPGQTQTMTVSQRNLSGTWTVTDVTIRNVAGNVVERAVTCVEGSLYTGSWRDDFAQWGVGGRQRWRFPDPFRSVRPAAR